MIPDHRAGAAMLSILLLSAACTADHPATDAGGAPGLDAGGTDGGWTSGDAGAGSDGGSPPPSDAGAPTTQVVDVTGGVIEHDGLRLEVPADALTEATTITITTVTGEDPAGFTLLSAVYRFEPAGLTFATPVTVTIPLITSGTEPAVFWSHASGVGYGQLATTVGSGTVSAPVDHFSIGFAAESASCGGTYEACCGTDGCEPGLVCQGGDCNPCGNQADPCCEGDTCNPLDFGRLECRSVDGAPPSCQVCGNSWPEPTPCCGGTTCLPTADNFDRPQFCAQGGTLTEATCVDCGMFNQLCCPPGGPGGIGTVDSTGTIPSGTCVETGTECTQIPDGRWYCRYP